MSTVHSAATFMNKKARDDAKLTQSLTCLPVLYVHGDGAFLLHIMEKIKKGEQKPGEPEVKRVKRLSNLSVVLFSENCINLITSSSFKHTKLIVLFFFFIVWAHLCYSGKRFILDAPGWDSDVAFNLICLGAIMHKEADWMGEYKAHCRHWPSIY